MQTIPEGYFDSAFRGFYMTFIEALEHLKHGDTITPNDGSFYVIEGKKIWNYYKANGLRCRVPATFDSFLVLEAKWKVLTIGEENEMRGRL
jgi:hypothetical protein